MTDDSEASAAALVRSPQQVIPLLDVSGPEAELLLDNRAAPPQEKERATSECARLSVPELGTTHAVRVATLPGELA